ncbi:hypothetical protein K435DRAFT_974757 [Dendrothele bispora CBS 962.96]|uniref:DUF6534 domain-containing protein n=1 Tax=Dendrothele bispora (strain CBS 962.96) TaxID=1314807 RepID=A0A4S8KJE6_DENBC|nr:hypothetical protein K435DRAFT_974757 [Dendrothele bispora CBS 962.96]
MGSIHGEFIRSKDIGVSQHWLFCYPLPNSVQYAGLALRWPFLGLGEGSLPPKILSVWLISSVICDVTIAITLMILLPRALRLLIKSRAKSVVLKIMRVVIETGLITAFSALLQLMFFFIFRNTLFHTIFYYMLAKTYSNSMMAVLNARITGRVWKQVSGLGSIANPAGLVRAGARTANSKTDGDETTT